LASFRFPMHQSTRPPNLKFARPTPMWRLPYFLRLNKFRSGNSQWFKLVLTFDVVELGSGVQISHLARGGIEVTERLAQPDFPTPTELSAAKSEV
jgi:hypothetical protein